MPSYRTAFPSKYLKADDLGTSRPIVTIASVDFEDVGAGTKHERKLVIHFEEQVKPLVLNLVNCDTIAEITETEDYEAWPGHRIQLFVTKTEFQGKRVPCIRISPSPTPVKTKSRAVVDDVPADDVGF